MPESNFRFAMHLDFTTWNRLHNIAEASQEIPGPKFSDSFETRKHKYVKAGIKSCTSGE